MSIASAALATSTATEDAFEISVKEVAIPYGANGNPATAKVYGLRNICSVVPGGFIMDKYFPKVCSVGGPADSVPLDPAVLCGDTKSALAALEKVDYRNTTVEGADLQLLHSLYWVKKGKAAAADMITADMVRSVRPGFGLAPKHLDHVIGSRLIRNVYFGLPVKDDSFE